MSSKWNEWLNQVESADGMKMYRLLDGHDCHPDNVECCDGCLILNGFDVNTSWTSYLTVVDAKFVKVIE